MLKNAGAKEVHMLVSCPAHRHPCVFGVDFPTREELIAHGKYTEEIALELGLDPRLDSLHYLSEQGLREAVGGGDNLCFACYNGQYPI
jgi:amidophosphoribosyltransferase